MLTKLAIAALAGTLATTAYAQPASAHEYERADAYWRHQELERRERWEHARRYNAWRRRLWLEQRAQYNPYRGYVVPRYQAAPYRAW